MNRRSFLRSVAATALVGLGIRLTSKAAVLMAPDEREIRWYAAMLGPFMRSQEATATYRVGAFNGLRALEDAGIA